MFYELLVATKAEQHSFGRGWAHIVLICPHVHFPFPNALYVSPLAIAKLNHYSCEATRDYEGGASSVMIQSQAENSGVVENILQEISAIRQFLEKRDAFCDIAREWLQVGYVLDVLLFRVYLIAVLAYSITLGTLWSIWQYA